MKREVALHLRDIHFGYGHQNVLKSVSLDIFRNELFAIVGQSGSGRSTLLKICAGLLEPTLGAVSMNIRAQKEDGTPNVAFVFQAGGLLSNMTALENLALPLLYHTSLPASEITSRARNALHEANADDCADLRPDEMNLASLRKAAMAQVIFLQPEIIFYDEPMLGLDEENAALIRRLITKLNQNGNVTSVLATADATLASSIADRVAFLANGRVQQLISSSDLPAGTRSNSKENRHGIA